MWIAFLPIISKYWKPLALLVLSLGLITGAYYKGYQKGKNKVIQTVEHTVYVEVEKRHEAAEQERTRVEQIGERIAKDRRESPINDKRDSCLLSEDPFTERCL